MLMLNMLKQKTEEQFGTSFLSSKSFRQLFPGASFIRELETPHGRPDAVLFDTKPRTSSALAKAIIGSPSSSAFAAVFFCLKNHDTPLSLNEIALKTGLSSSYARTIIKSLLENDLLKKPRSNRYSLKAKAQIPHTSIVSIEFKLYDWKKALKQSVRHLAFADEAYVIMPFEKRSLLLEKLSYFDDFGISVGVYDTRSKSLEILSYSISDSKSEISYIDVVSRILANKQAVGQI